MVWGRGAVKENEGEDGLCKERENTIFIDRDEL